jgi:hypothetical protein
MFDATQTIVMSKSDFFVRKRFDTRTVSQLEVQTREGVCSTPDFITSSENSDWDVIFWRLDLKFGRDPGKELSF